MNQQIPEEIKEASNYLEILAAYEPIMRSEVFRLNGPEIDLPEALIRLGEVLHESDLEGSEWCLIGEHSEAPLDDLVIGAYWALTEWHGGQDSPSYSAMCCLGEVFKPGYTYAPQPEESEYTAYEMVVQWFQEQADKAAAGMQRQTW